MTRNDNWGWQARIGMFIVSSEAVPEAEWWAMTPPGVSVHAARITAPTPWAPWNEGRTAVTLSDDLERGARQFAAMRLSAVVIGHSSSSLVGGHGWDEAVIDQLSRVLVTPDAPSPQVTTNALDCLAALDASGVRHPFLVLPAWFNEATVAKGVKFFEDHGVAPAGTLSYDPGPGWRDMAPGDLYPQGMGFAQQIEPLYTQIRDAVPAAADGVLIAGTGFRCVGILEALERDIARPVISANQASLWRCLRLSGVRAEVSGYGNLFTL